MTQFRLDPDHPAALKPGKRPRLTPNASMVTRNGELFMTFGTPEGDQQPQALVQVFLNMIVFNMDIQEAIDLYYRQEPGQLIGYPIRRLAGGHGACNTGESLFIGGHEPGIGG